MDFPEIDKTTWFYKNCKRQRRLSAKICQICPFRAGIEKQEKESNAEFLLRTNEEIKNVE